VWEPQILQVFFCLEVSKSTTVVHEMGISLFCTKFVWHVTRSDTYLQSCNQNERKDACRSSRQGSMRVTDRQTDGQMTSTSCYPIVTSNTEGNRKYRLNKLTRPYKHCSRKWRHLTAERLPLADSLPTESLLPAASACSTLPAHCVTIMSGSTNATLLYGEILIYIGNEMHYSLTYDVV
jgi:hypothetical protein